MSSTFPPAPADKETLESAGSFSPKFDAHGLVTAVVTDIKDGELLMVAHMNAQALSLTLETGIAHYYSRSRNKIWKKGETSGNLQTVKEIRTDCDQDAVWLKVSVAGHDATCHTGRRSCFYRTVTLENGKAVTTITDDVRHFDPAKTYGSPENLLTKD
ncbi:phosphoribosyl-AMP cyclohydrolase [Agrobacterium rosae]|uniref:Phosphoribosyl-AMP cyclohydrolase n=1 Tax=Agrobacterium rosae TaxID=1972867 RepID=A0AAE5RZ45_9HYPH|nr:phosphoribosyl-AMP cyclohydrolase [Agrobacterium rosae]KAA3512199.1 phosphoribosyl-AMP cyclohydrolase [Agrobacterium rosae]KAA3520571.1 phosphoribosyl-AMP cyclohydrolase [Agrobacterium rosae]MCM2432234.1 phosphoribosyl-AMP cyclohydrolase [Agrobacterium rosae]MDX8327626.1 phosphoribosyl-AMP cyclohydrolase [Agrobacterium rosae]MQB48811.1 phosphoribosyl-AMP cyclohydrolase [Agrobacterium rosae]